MKPLFEREYRHKYAGCGSRPKRWLKDDAIKRANIKSRDISHQIKFMSPGKRLATALAMQS